MIFAELPLFAAIYDAYAIFENHRSENWIILSSNKEKLYKFIRNELPVDYPVPLAEYIFQCWTSFGKNKVDAKDRPEGEPSEERPTKTQLTVQVYRRDGPRCFYAGRGKGECSEEVELDRILPGIRGGKYIIENLMLACSRHNSARGGRSIEEFIANGL